MVTVLFAAWSPMHKSPLLSLIGIGKAYPQQSGIRSGIQTIVAVDDITLEVQAGISLGIAGESGCGKSTIAKIAAGLLEPDSGTVRFQGIERKLMSPEQQRLFRRSVQMVFQDPFSSLNPRIRVGDAISEPLQLHTSLSPEERLQEVIRLLEVVGLSADHYNRFPHEFSGGQRQRIGIARALAANPKLLIADEPVSALDISIQAQILNLMLDLKTQTGMTSMIISHDLSVLYHLCDRLVVMFQGTIVEDLPAADLFTASCHPYTLELLSSVPGTVTELSADSIDTIPVAPITGCPYAFRCKKTDERCLTERPYLSAIPSEQLHVVACHHSGQP